MVQRATLIKAGLLAGALLAGGLVVAASLTLLALTRPGPHAADTVVLVPKGASVTRTAGLLAEHGVLSRPRLLVAYARVSGAAGGIRAGEFVIPAGASPLETLAVLRDGPFVQRRVTVAEGMTSAQVVALLRTTDGLDGTIETMPEEGGLLPETYYFVFGDTRADMLARMRAARDDTLYTLWDARAADLPFDTPEDAVILASIVEKETAVPAERPLVAGVFVNRLRRGMRLQSDPTVIYGLTGGEPLGRRIRRSELDRTTPYNTYRVGGLPPTAIANPGRASLAAVLRPIDTPYLYFVADGTGGHVFAKTLSEHNTNVARWRRLQRQQRARQGE